MLTTEQLKELKIGDTVKYYGFDHKVVVVGNGFIVTEGVMSRINAELFRRLFSYDNIPPRVGDTRRLKLTPVKKYVNVYGYGLGALHSSLEACADKEVNWDVCIGRLELTHENGKLVDASVVDLSS